MRKIQVFRAAIIAAQFSCFAVTTSHAQALSGSIEKELVTPVAIEAGNGGGRALRGQLFRRLGIFFRG